MKLSIIIPAYNVASYIKDCLESVLDQGINNNEYEVIIVDDGSTDNTIAMINLVSHRILNFKLIASKENLGNGSARNLGLECAQGKYIYFLDADDYLAQGSLSTILNLADQYHLEMTFFKAINITDSFHTHSSTTDANSYNTEAIKVVDGITFIGENSYRDEVWNYLINHQFLKESQIRYYDEKMFGQDIFITSKLLTIAKKVCLLDYDVYRYRQTENSIVKNKNIKHLIFFIYSIDTALIKCYDLRLLLIDSGINNSTALLRLKVKQERLVTIILMKFIQTNLPFDFIVKKLNTYKKMGIYPMNSIFELKDFDFSAQRKMIPIFNNIFLLRTFTFVYRSYKKII